MTHAEHSKIVLFFTLIVLSGFSADAAEVRLKSEHHCRSALVLLGDVAEVHDTDANKQAALSQIELFPAPARVENIRQREIQELLALRGVSLADCRFAGASIVKIHPMGAEQAKSETARSFGRGELDHTRQRVEQAIVAYLQANVDPTAPWEVKLQADEPLVQLASASDAALTVDGGRTPWVGKQSFVVSAQSRDGMTRSSVSAQVTVPTMILTAVRPIRRGDIVQAADVQLQPATDFANVRDVIHRVEEVVGKEANRPIAAGQPLDSQAIRLPLLVRRGELVTVVARAAGVQVRTTARAQDEGSRGDVITIQSLENQQRYSARVADFRTVEVYARGPTVSSVGPNEFSSGPDGAPRRISISDIQPPTRLER
jgi:flagella basal body P-ring formation protein FlgA